MFAVDVRCLRSPFSILFWHLQILQQQPHRRQYHGDTVKRRDTQYSVPVSSVSQFVSFYATGECIIHEHVMKIN